ncbi:MAG TPA: tetratricopeptide repeat protein [Burkholderiaceae bacterium]|nr:tetratricopeptide repeat protein [Burkholderiaceae bacterium]
MAYDLEEQEQLAELKAWWTSYGKLVVALVVIGAVVLGGWYGWRAWQKRQSAQASAMYEALQSAVQSKNAASIKTLHETLAQKHGGTVYATMGGLLAAKAAVDAGDLEAAKTALRQVVDHASTDDARAMARLRLAGLLLDQKSYDEALKLLDGAVPDAFIALFADRRGDVLVAQGKIAEARKAYGDALAKLGNDDGGLRSLVQIKLDALGEG